MIVFSQFNYTKPDGFMLFYCQILLNFQGAYALMHVRSLRSLLKEGAITFQDIDDFSDELKDTVKYFAGSSFKI